MHTSIGIIAAFITVGSWTVGTFSFTAASKLVEPLSVNRVRLLYAFLLLTVLCFALYQLNPIQLFSLPDAQQWLWLGISGVVGLTIGDYFAFTAYKLIGSSRASLFVTIAPVAALLLGVLLLGETLNWVGLVGMAVSVSGILWFVRSQNKSHHIENTQLPKAVFLKGAIFALLGAVGQGLGLVCAKKGLIHPGTYELPPIHATWIRMGIGAGVTYIIGAFRSNLVSEFKNITFNKVNFKPIITGTLFGPVLGVTMSLLAAKNMEVSLAQTIFSLLPISVMFTAHFTGKEKVSLSSYIAAFISICGVIILVWRNEIMN